MLLFSTIAEVSGDSKRKLKELDNIFTPNREGKLSRIDFIRVGSFFVFLHSVESAKTLTHRSHFQPQCTDAVYREVRTLSANIDNSAVIDKAYEKILNAIFGVLVLIMALTIIGIDPFSLLLGLSSIFISFAFMIGSASR